jgi:hypothetical protein
MALFLLHVYDADDITAIRVRFEFVLGGAQLTCCFANRGALSAVILSAAKNLIQYGVAQTATSSASSSLRLRSGSMGEILRRKRRSSG